MNNNVRASGQNILTWREGLFVLGLALVVIAWGSTTFTAQLGMGGPATQQKVLSACSGASMLFPRTDRSGDLDRWIAQYHNKVGQVVTETMSKVQSPSCDEMRQSDTSAAVQTLAMQLPAWQGRMPLVQLADTPAVLLEHLRVYECTLKEWDTFLPARVGIELAPSAAIPAPATPIVQFFMINAATNRFMTDHWKITLELLTARRALHRTLLTLGSLTRFAPLSQSMDCLQRSSVDLRNVLGLAAEASACMPRAWDARSPLRNTAQ